MALRYDDSTINIIVVIIIIIIIIIITVDRCQSASCRATRWLFID